MPQGIQARRQWLRAAAGWAHDHGPGWQELQTKWSCSFWEWPWTRITCLRHYTIRAGLDQFALLPFLLEGSYLIFLKGLSKREQQVPLLNHVKSTNFFFQARASVNFGISWTSQDKIMEHVLLYITWNYQASSVSANTFWFYLDSWRKIYAMPVCTLQVTNWPTRWMCARSLQSALQPRSCECVSAPSPLESQAVS